MLDLAGTRGMKLDWSMAARVAQCDVAGLRVVPDAVPRITMAASSLARKGAFELREALQGLRVEICLPPGAQETPEFWAGFNVRRMPSMQAAIEVADLVVLPAWVEHQPRALLAAMLRGTPVIATPACGLPSTLPWLAVQPGDSQALRACIERYLPAG
ncbi:MAG: glycosyltransferase [Oxalobacteraceae bacterium]|nr:MAG: glycosyltransferase [Oxalobacteraceae bacterium]